MGADLKVVNRHSPDEAEQRSLLSIVLNTSRLSPDLDSRVHRITDVRESEQVFVAALNDNHPYAYITFESCRFFVSFLGEERNSAPKENPSQTSVHFHDIE